MLFAAIHSTSTTTTVVLNCAGVLAQQLGAGLRRGHQVRQVRLQFLQQEALPQREEGSQPRLCRALPAYT